jgi:hypothetical protein
MTTLAVDCEFCGHDRWNCCRLTEAVLCGAAWENRYEYCKQLNDEEALVPVLIKSCRHLGRRWLEPYRPVNHEVVT